MADANYSDVVLLLPMNGADGGTTFTDYSPTQKIATVSGNAHTETDQSKFYGSSGAFDGNSDRLLVTDNRLPLSTGDFTAEAWVYKNNATDFCLIDFTTASNRNNGFLIKSLVNGTVMIFSTGATKITTSLAVSTATWTHIALCRASGTWTVYIDGIADAATWSSNHDCSSISVFIGEQVDGQADANGYIQDLRITKGVARYTENFTPPGQLIKSISGTITDAAGNPAARTVIAVPRSYPNTSAFTTQSSAVDGTYSLTVPGVECSVIALADETTLYNDIVNRVLPG